MPNVVSVKPTSIRELWSYLLDVHSDHPEPKIKPGEPRSNHSAQAGRRNWNRP